MSDPTSSSGSRGSSEYGTGSFHPGPDDADITRLLSAYAEGEEDALGELVPKVYDHLKYIAAKHMKRVPSHSLDTTLVVHEAYLKLAGANAPKWENRAHFFAVASRAMRQLIMDHARRKNAAKRGGGVAPVELLDNLAIEDVRSDELLALDEALTQLTSLEPRLGQVVELRYFGGLTVEEVGEVLGVTDRTVKRDWAEGPRVLAYIAAFGVVATDVRGSCYRRLPSRSPPVTRI